MGPRITVVGAGVVGLTSAIRLAEAGHTVDVLARELPLETTSATAGGLWLPFLADPGKAVAGWAKLTLETMLELADSRPGTSRSRAEALDSQAGASGSAGPSTGTGIAVREGYLLGTGPTRPSWADELSERVDLAPIANPAPGHSHGWQLRVPLVDMQVYLPYLVDRLRAAGGTLTRLPLTALPTRGLVVNCTGLAARALAADPAVHPVRGQVVWTTNPGLSTWWADESDRGSDLTYVLPHPGHVVLGGTIQDGDWSTTPDNETTAQILERARKLVPALRTATVLSQRVGLRPVRPSVRLETVAGPEGTLVHCYGHGGSGVTLSWGCAADVLEAVNKII
jgi:D-amino-acid oxidase